MANYKSKNLCDKTLKIKNLNQQFCCIFRWLRHGILPFFWRCYLHGDIRNTKLPVLRFFKKSPKHFFFQANSPTRMHPRNFFLFLSRNIFLWIFRVLSHNLFDLKFAIFKIFWFWSSTSSSHPVTYKIQTNTIISNDNIQTHIVTTSRHVHLLQPSTQW